MRRILAATIVCAFAGVTLVRADEAQHRALAEELLDAMQMQKTIEKSSEILKQMIPAQMKQMGVSVNASTDETQDFMQKMMDLIMKEPSWEMLKDDYITVYAETFTEEELSGLVTFYTSPIGRKYTEKQPELMKRIMQISQKQMIEFMPEIEKLTQEMMQEAEESLARANEMLQEADEALARYTEILEATEILEMTPQENVHPEDSSDKQ